MKCKQINIPQGFKFHGSNLGIKKHNPDFGVILADNICNSAAVFTKNTFCGVSIPIGKKNLENGKLQAIVVTSGIANVATGNKGSEHTKKILTSLSKELNINSEDILPSSTGVIGKYLPVDKIITNIPRIKEDLEYENYENFAKAILTTDKCTKIVSKKIGNSTILGIAKGSGMIEPNMATMLCYILTDADIEKEKLSEVLKNSVDLSFNMISIDTDMSTSDTVAIMANGTSGKVNIEEFEIALKEVCLELSRKILLDAEGATKIIEVNINKAKNFDQAKIIGKSIVNSPLVKTAIYGSDPNWGRIVMAIGKTMIEDIDPEKIKISFGKYLIYNCGEIYDEKIYDIKDYFENKTDITIDIEIGLGNSSAKVWGVDLTEEYVKINGLYTS